MKRVKRSVDIIVLLVIFGIAFIIGMACVNLRAATNVLELVVAGTPGSGQTSASGTQTPTPGPQNGSQSLVGAP